MKTRMLENTDPTDRTSKYNFSKNLSYYMPERNLFMLKIKTQKGLEKKYLTRCIKYVQHESLIYVFTIICKQESNSCALHPP